MNPEPHLFFNLTRFPPNRCRNRGRQTIPFIELQVIWYFWVSSQHYFSKYSLFCKKMLIWLWLWPRQPGTYLILEWPKKRTCWNNICSLSPGDHDCVQLFLQLVVFRKLLAENRLDKLCCTDHIKCNSPTPSRLKDRSRRALCAGCTCKSFCAGCVWPISSLPVDPDQANPRHTPNPNPNPLGEYEVGRGSHAAPPRVLMAFFQDKHAAQKASLTH